VYALYEYGANCEDFFLYANAMHFNKRYSMVNSVEMTTALMKSNYSEIPNSHHNHDSHGCPAQEPDNLSYYYHCTVHQHRQQLKLIFNSELDFLKNLYF
jgi:hypothetical protein